MTTQRKRILIIDDIPANLSTFGTALGQEFRLQVATSGEAGLLVAKKHPPDLILLDIMMPGIDGYETCRRFKSDPDLRRIPIIFITAMTESEAESAGLELGAADYITKPLNLRIARQRIRNLLEREGLRKEVEAANEKLRTYQHHLEELVQARTLALSVAEIQVTDLEGIAYFDPLTNIPNRRLLVDRLGQSLAQAKRTEQWFAVCYFDLDGFKQINDHLGHDAGDELLRTVTSRLKEILREQDTLARVGGDEFVLVLCNLEHEMECYSILERVLATIRVPLTIKDQSISVSASLGVTIYPHDDAEVGDLIRHADQAMYGAKNAGKNCFFVYKQCQGHCVTAGSAQPNTTLTTPPPDL